MKISKPYHTSHNQEIECVDLNDIFEQGSPVDVRKAEKLLRFVHAGVYNDTFPIPCEQESVDYWLGNLRKGREEGQQLLSVFGKNLDTDQPEVMGFVCSRILDDSNCALIDYRIRPKEYQHILSGIEITEHAAKGLEDLNQKVNNQPLIMVCGEINDPAKVPYDEKDPDKEKIDCMAPQKRYDHFVNNMGYRKLGFDFTQGPLDPCSNQEEVDEGVCDTLLLMLHNPAKYNKVTAADIEKFVINYNKATNGQHPRELNHPSLTKMMDQLEVMKKYNIPVLEESQSFEQKLLINNADKVLNRAKKVHSNVHKQFSDTRMRA